MIIHTTPGEDKLQKISLTWRSSNRFHCDSQQRENSLWEKWQICIPQIVQRRHSLTCMFILNRISLKMFFIQSTQIIIFIILWYLTNPVKPQETTCTSIDNFSSLRYGYVQNSEFLDFAKTTLIGCVKQCQLRRRCTSFNFNVTSGTCFLNEKPSTDSSSQVIPFTNSVYSDIGTWPSRLAGACESHTCPENAECRETDSGDFDCDVTSCVDPPGVDNGEVCVLVTLDTLDFWFGINNMTCIYSF